MDKINADKIGTDKTNANVAAGADAGNVGRRLPRRHHRGSETQLLKAAATRCAAPAIASALKMTTASTARLALRPAYIDGAAASCAGFLPPSSVLCSGFRDLTAAGAALHHYASFA
ncbi:MAG: hypothetical protein KY475_03955 [Planctomycetes bacterium]|nr:hypothetical protein [Planctomycetota bacterium]